jgi:hypothetical protein
VFAYGERVYARCSDGSLLRLLEVQWGSDLQPLEALCIQLGSGAWPLTGKGTA